MAKRGIGACYLVQNLKNEGHGSCSIKVGGGLLSHRDFEQNYPVIVRLSLLITGLAIDQFRGKDIIFNVDLIKSLMSGSNHFIQFELQATQIHRMMDKYSKQGWVDIITIGAGKHYKLRPAGVIGFLESLVDFDYVIPLTETVMIQWFLKTYSVPIMARIRPHTSESVQKRLEQKLEEDYIIKAQLKLLDAGAQEMMQRISQSQQLQDYIKLQLDAGKELIPSLKALPTEYSYRLTHQKRFWQWLSELPEDVQKMEVERGFNEREKLLYGNTLRAILHLKAFYEGLVKDHHES